MPRAWRSCSIPRDSGRPSTSSAPRWRGASSSSTSDSRPSRRQPPPGPASAPVRRPRARTSRTSSRTSWRTRCAARTTSSSAPRTRPVTCCAPGRATSSSPSTPRPCTGRRLRIVVECKDRAISGRAMRDELEEARRNRDAAVALVVFSAAHAPAGIAPFDVRQGRRLLRHRPSGSGRRHPGSGPATGPAAGRQRRPAGRDGDRRGGRP